MSNPSLKIKFDKAYPGLYDSIKPSKRGIYPSKPPRELTWHHNIYEEGLMELIPKTHHQSSGPVQYNFHPGKKGGMEIWGGGYPKKKINKVKKIKEEDNG